MLNKIRLLTPGPTPLPEVVRLALAQDMIHHREEDFEKIMLSLQSQLQALFGTESPVLPLSCSGSGAMTAAVYSLFRPGEKVLVVDAGKFGERWREIAEARGLNVKLLKIQWGESANPDQIGAILGEDRDIKGVLLQVCETSTGVQQPIEAISSVVAASGALLVADGVSAVGIAPCPMDEWKIDCLITGSQKGLMLPPGLALLALSPRAWKVAESMPPGCFYFNLPRERENLKKGQTLFTPAINLIFGLKASMDFMLQNGLSSVYRKQWAMTMLTRFGVEAMGLECFAQQNFAWGITSVLMPAGVNGARVRAEAWSKYGVCMAGGQDALKGRIIRIGHMGWVDWADCLAGLYALANCLAGAGDFSPRSGYAEKAMSAYNAALVGKPGVVPAL